MLGSFCNALQQKGARQLASQEQVYATHVMRILRVILRPWREISRAALQRFLCLEGGEGRLCYAGSGENAK